MQPDAAIRLIADAAGVFPTPGQQVFLRKHPAFSKVMAGDDTALVELAGDVREAAGLDSPPSLGDRQRGDPRDRHLVGWVTPRERKQAGVLSGRLARTAETDVLMQRFRQKLFGTVEPLERSAARGVLASPILPIMTKQEMDRLGIPVVGHTATLSEIQTGLDEQVGRWSNVRIQVHWPGGKHVESRRIPFDPMYAVHQRLIKVFGRDAAVYGLLDYEFPYLERHGKAGPDQRVPVHPGSVLDLVRRAARSLARRMGWSEADAVEFIVAGTVPRVLPVTVVRRTWVTGLQVVILTALPFASRASVARAFARATRDAAGKAEKPSTSTLVAFVDERTARNGGPPEVHPRRSHWKGDRPAGCRPYRDYRDLRRTYCRAVERAKKRPRRVLNSSDS